MSFPSGAQTITLTGTFPVPVGGSARAGRIVLTPSATLVDATQKAIYSGGGTVPLDNAGKFSVVLLCDNDTDIQPAGWRWRVDEQPAGGPRRTYWIALPSTLGPTVDLSTLASVDEPDGGSGGSLTATPAGPAGGALTGTYPNPQLSSATIAGFDPAGAAIAAQTAAATDATTKANAAQAAATSAAATDATAKVAAHTAASDPHGDRAVAAAALAAHEADTTSVHGIPNTADLETQAGAQTKATAAQTAATSAAAADATSKVTAHANAPDPHGDRAAAASDATSKVSAHAAAVDPHGDRAWADTKFATQLDLTALGGTVNTLDGYLNNALTRIQAVEQGTAYLAGGHFTDDVEVIDANLTVRGASVVLTTEDQVVGGEKSFTSIPVLPGFDAEFGNQAVRLAQLDAAIAGVGGGSTIRSATARIVDGAVVDLPSAASWVIAETSVGTKLKCSIAAAAGDRVRVEGDFMRSGAHFLDWVLLDSAGVIAIYGTTRTSTPPSEGAPSMYPSTSFPGIQGAKQFVIGAGHITSGQVTIALAHQGTAAGRVYANSTYPFEMLLTNLGPEPS
ncbi:hypothetical protein [Streptomyces sp. NPDC001652]|uniref:hypothetical protein n=1 Tax=Streptomyces sp. NPDC001652 TaxID=3154393 RepID=UPI00333444CF